MWRSERRVRALKLAYASFCGVNQIRFDDIHAQRLDFFETADAPRDGNIVAGCWNAGLPYELDMNLARMRNIAVMAQTENRVAIASKVLKLSFLAKAARLFEQKVRNLRITIALGPGVLPAGACMGQKSCCAMHPRRLALRGF